MHKSYNRRYEPEYWKNTEKGYPQTYWWKIVAGNRKLTVLEEYDLVFSVHDARYVGSL